MSVCYSSRVFVRLTKDIYIRPIYLTANESQIFRTVFSENAPLRENKRNKRKKPIANVVMSIYSLTAALLQIPLYI